MFSCNVSRVDVENTQQNPLACSMQKQQIIITIPLARKPLECFAVAILNAEPFSSPSPMSTSALSEVDALFCTGWFNFTTEFSRVLPALNRVPAFFPMQTLKLVFLSYSFSAIFDGGKDSPSVFGYLVSSSVSHPVQTAVMFSSFSSFSYSMVLKVAPTERLK